MDPILCAVSSVSLRDVDCATGRVTLDGLELSPQSGGQRVLGHRGS